VTYDPNGGYGHPDHVHTHTVTTAAVAAAGSRAGSDDYPGEPWTVPKFYWTVLAESAFEAGWRALNRDDLLPDWTIPPREEFDFGYADSDIDAVVETGPDALAAKAAALAAHSTQVVVGPTGRACALSNNMALPIVAHEHYVLAAGSAGERDDRGWETDLLAGLD
jgi:N-acetyl-1-D-myo-inositol-2-amino-2-deoxy-alpha-D-glucopyranoside deacetylase